MPVNFGKGATKYLIELHEKLEIAKYYAALHAEHEQNRYVTHFNLRNRDKHFEVGEQVLILSLILLHLTCLVSGRVLGL